MNKQTAAHKALAEIIKAQRDIAEENRNSAETIASAEYWQGQKTVLWTVAEKYAEQTGVDKALFMKACGIGYL